MLLRRDELSGFDIFFCSNRILLGIKLLIELLLGIVILLLMVILLYYIVVFETFYY
jgi:hypothetical protein